MNIKQLTAIVILSSIGFLASSANAGTGTELNVRQNIGNQSMNKVASARLRGMFAEGPTETVKSTKEFGKRGCVTSIGNQQSGSSLMGQPRDVLITGDVTNVCF